MTAPITERLAARIFASPDKLEDAVLVTRTAGTRNAYGEFARGLERVTPVRLATAPLSGRDRETLPEGLHDEDLRRFWMPGTAETVREGERDGDIVRYGGVDYRAVRVQQWGAFTEVWGVASQ